MPRPGPGGPRGGPHGGPHGGHHGGPGFGGPHGGPGFGPPPPPPPHHHGGWRRGYGYGPGCGGCLFSFLFIIGLGIAGVAGITSLIVWAYTWWSDLNL